MQNKFDEINVSDKLDSVVSTNMKKIKKAHKKAVIKKTFIGFGTTVTVLTCVQIFCVNNPVFASKLPFIGEIFTAMQEEITYSGDYNEVATPLETSADTLLNTEKTVGDVSVNLVEYYCNNQALYLSLLVTAEDGFGEIRHEYNNINEELTYMMLMTEETYSFNSTVRSDLLRVEGKFIDEKTFAGVLRINLINGRNLDYTEAGAEEAAAREQAKIAGEQALGTGIEGYDEIFMEVDIPSEFSLDFKITEIVFDKENPDEMMSEEELLSLTDEEREEYTRAVPNTREHIWFDGPFEFDLAITKNETSTITKEVGTTNDDGIGIKSLVKSPFEITINGIYPSTETGIDYIPVILDANGERLYDSEGGNATTVAIQNRDVSTVDIYICHWDQYAQIKGTNLTKEILEENAVYHETVEFE